MTWEIIFSLPPAPCPRADHRLVHPVTLRTRPTSSQERPVACSPSLPRRGTSMDGDREAADEGRNRCLPRGLSARLAGLHDLPLPRQRRRRHRAVGPRAACAEREGPASLAHHQETITSPAPGSCGRGPVRAQDARARPQPCPAPAAFASRVLDRPGRWRGSPRLPIACGPYHFDRAAEGAIPLP